MDRVGDDGLDVLHHEGVRRVHEVVRVPLRRALQAQLTVHRNLQPQMLLPLTHPYSAPGLYELCIKVLLTGLYMKTMELERRPS